MRLACGCSIIPLKVLEKLSEDGSLSDASRRSFLDTSRLDPKLRRLRNAQPAAGLLGMAPLTATPSVMVFDCRETTSLPGALVPTPDKSTDASARRVFAETTAVAEFFSTCFGWNSVDGRGMTLVSSLHYGSRYNNAMWNGAQMIYGDGDGEIFVDFSAGIDVIAHELTHGVTQNTAGFVYRDQPGALNESISDVFGSMYRQWREKQTVDRADWLIGAEILGPAARARGLTCLRDMANPGADHCLSPQPSHYSDYIPGGDVHDNSGIPNRAFHLAAMALGGNSWTRAGKVWFAALTSRRTLKTSSIARFAGQTLTSAQTMFKADPAVYAAVSNAWKTVGVPV